MTGRARRLLAVQVTDIVIAMDEPDWDHMASEFLIDRLEELGWKFEKGERREVGSQVSQPRQEAA